MEPVLVTGAGTWNPVNLQRGIQREEKRGERGWEKKRGEEKRGEERRAKKRREERRGHEGTEVE